MINTRRKVTKWSMATDSPSIDLEESANDGFTDAVNGGGDFPSSDDDSSMSVHDSDALRLDILEQPKQKQLFYQGDEESELDGEVHQPQPLVHSPIQKHVRFNSQRRKQPDSEEDTSPMHPWEFRRVIRKEFREKLPKNYEIKRWRRPSKAMVNSVIQLLETNVESSLRQVLKKYTPELQAIEHTENVDKIFRQKQSIMNDIISKIKSQLKKSKFPSRISDRELEIEYIVSKRKFIQNRYAEELMNAERLERELLREQTLLNELKASCEAVKMNNRTSLTKGLMENNLHPSLNKAVENAYGLIADPSGSQVAGTLYKRDVTELNLKLKDPIKTSPSQEEAANLLPGLNKSNQASAELYNNLSNFAEPELQAIFQRLFSGRHGC
ncbi:hypothetical protein HG536_0E04570 [Torulaspora globosa]|uniref:Uncharacterized protein n=1 Tax=Torulaspora globosa TaxID=48254 RepID=A0A7G3ZJ60_9SACH|nr:uncharacterized protein HG536_0E04570 [Torulaspora globosa]QLL33546.1 hypothetical protein HG536_0E04570 [Torulaspora globosa]